MAGLVMTCPYFKPIKPQIKDTAPTAAARGYPLPLHTAVLALALLCPARADSPTPPLHVEAVKMENTGTLLRAEGEVKATFREYELCAGRITYDHSTGLIRAVEDIRLTHRSGEITGSAATYDLHQDSGEIRDFRTREETSGLRIEGEHAEWRENGLRARHATITSCPPDSDDWHLSAAQAETDDDRDTLLVRNVALHLAGVPVLYLPYGMFYYGEEKRSGFLAPRVQVDSGSGGGIAAPYYFALAPHYDLTFTPQYRSKHGVELGGELRFLTPQGGGEILVATAVGDEEGRGREKIDYRYSKDGLSVYLAAENVSDTAYLHDYAQDEDKSVRTLPRTAVVQMVRGNLYARAALEHFKSLDKNLTAPHRAMPQIDIGSSGSGRNYDWNTSAQLADFRHNTLADSWRAVWRGALRSTRRFNEVLLSPEFGAHAVHYRGSAQRSNFLVPYAKLNVERNASDVFADSAHGRDHLRLRAAGVVALRNKRQNSAPLLDTAVREPNSENLFEWNRFIGDDRASDSRFIAYGGSYHLFDGETERLFIGAAQRYHLQSAQVHLPQHDTPPVRGFGNVLLNGHLYLRGGWRAAAAAEWDAQHTTMERFYAEVHGAFAERKLLHLRYLMDDEESLVVGGALPLASWLDAAAQADYLLSEDRFSRSWLALQLRNDCDCWNISFTISDTVVQEGDNETRFSIGVELHGLGGIGSDYDSLLQRLR